MKKVVVVVATESGDLHKEFFEGEDLHIREEAGYIPEAPSTQHPLLTVEEKKQDIAIFRQWCYWRKLA